MFRFNEDTEWILGRPNFSCAAIARRLVQLGHRIEPRAEAEQAAVIYWMLCLYEKHGEDWRAKAQEYLRHGPEDGDEGVQQIANHALSTIHEA